MSIPHPLSSHFWSMAPFVGTGNASFAIGQPLPNIYYRLGWNGKFSSGAVVSHDECSYSGHHLVISTFVVFEPEYQ